MRPHLLLLAAAACSHAAVSPHSVIGDEARAAPAEEVPSGAAVQEVSSAARAPELQRAAEAEVRRDDPEAGVAAAAALARDHGGWVESMAAERVTVRVPDSQLDAVLAELPRLGELRARRVRAVDVGDTHRDLEVRIDTLRRTRQRYLALLDKAQGIAEATAVEHELERVTGRLERLEAELASLQKRIAYSGLSVDFSREVTPGPIGWVFYGAFTAVKKLFVWN
jgi:hypothetical protein